MVEVVVTQDLKSCSSECGFESRSGYKMPLWTNLVKSVRLERIIVGEGSNPFRGTKMLTYYTDHNRHLVCVPYSIENLHKMAKQLNIKRCWFHKNHYDVPKSRVQEIQSKCVVVSSKEIVGIIKNTR